MGVGAGRTAGGRADEARFVAPVDLDNCDREPIDIPGAIQPHGFLVGVTEPDLTIGIVSTNVAETFGTAPADAIGTTLGELLGDPAAAVVAAASGSAKARRIDDLALPLRGATASATLHRSGSFLIVEAEVDEESPRHVGSLVRDATTLL